MDNGAEVRVKSGRVKGLLIESHQACMNAGRYARMREVHIIDVKTDVNQTLMALKALADGLP